MMRMTKQMICNISASVVMETILFLNMFYNLYNHLYLSHHFFTRMDADDGTENVQQKRCESTAKQPTGRQNSASMPQQNVTSKTNQACSSLGTARFHRTISC